MEGLDLEVVDMFEGGLLDARRWPTDKLVHLVEHHLDALEADAARGIAIHPPSQRVRAVVRALLTIACREASDIDGYSRRESCFVHGQPLVGEGAADFLRSTLWRDRVRLGLEGAARPTPA